MEIDSIFDEVASQMNSDLEQFEYAGYGLK